MYEQESYRTNRRTFTLALCLGISALSSRKIDKDAVSYLPYISKSTEDVDFSRFGELAYLSALKHFSASNDTFYQIYPWPSPYAKNWSFSRLMQASITRSRILGLNTNSTESDIRKITAGLQYYQNPIYSKTDEISFNENPHPPFELSGQTYYDDNAWVGINFLDLYQISHNKQDLDLASKIFHFEVNSWGVGFGCDPKEGIPWRTGLEQSRNACNHFPTAELGFRLYQQLNDPYYLTEGGKILKFANATFLDPSTMQVYDHINSSCQLNRKVWTYNQGAAIIANAYHYLETGDTESRKNALGISNQSIIDWDGIHYKKHQVEFVNIFFRDLFFAAKILKEKDLLEKAREKLQNYALPLWHNPQIHRATHLFSFNQLYFELIHQAAVADIFYSLAEINQN